MGIESPRVLYAGSHRHARYIPHHVHHGLELTLVNEGSCLTEVEGADAGIEARRGDLLILPAERSHDQLRHGTVRTTYVSFLPGAVEFDDSPRLIHVGLRSPEARWITDIHSFFRVESPAQACVADALLAAVLANLKWREGACEYSVEPPRPVAEAVRMLRSRLTETVSLTETAKAVCVSPSRLIELFRKHFGVGPIHYQQSLRMRLARMLLHDAHRRVSEVAQECGYQDVNYFVRLFRKLHGLPPGKWRAARLRHGPEATWKHGGG